MICDNIVKTTIDKNNDEIMEIVGPKVQFKVMFVW